MNLKEKYPPSGSCTCDICKSFCIRPGWWTVEEAEKAIDAGLASRMMIEISPEHSFGVLAPAFKGNESNYAFAEFSQYGCTFLNDGKCELFDTGHMPLECRYCHHSRKGKGQQCHSDIEKDWKTMDGQKLIVKWGNIIGFWERQGLKMILK
ncbi:MAG TPA: hypothetical protein VHO50_01365 [Bacteroidales bacterium]|nr:hypothetical protein [Bacteroidales bacterium]